MSNLLRGAKRRDINLTVRVTQQQYTAYRAAAESMGARTLSEAVTSVLDAWAAETNKKGRKP